MGLADLLWIALAVITSFLISYLSMPVIIQIAGLKKLIDEPDDDRKSHEGIVPTLGGIGIFAAFLISFSIWGEASNMASYPFFVAALFMLFLIGIKDDILVISPHVKLFVQVLAAAEIVLAGQIYIDNLYGIFGIYQIPWIAGAILSIFVIVALVNAYNLIDGIDGLAGGVGIIASGILGIWFLGAGFYSLSILSFVLTGSLIGFLMFNMHPAKIFMGDTGAMALGFILAFLSLQFIRLNDTMAGTGWHLENAPAMAIAIMIIPIIDTLRVAAIRLLSGKPLFKADQNHIHHRLLDMNIPPHLASFTLWMANFVIIGLAFSLLFIEPNILLLLILTSGLLVLPVIRWFISHIKTLQRLTHETLHFLHLYKKDSKEKEKQNFKEYFFQD